MNPAIEVNELRVTRAEREVLHGISLIVEDCEVFGLLGRNGVGKSTLMSCLMGLLDPTSGEVTVQGVRGEGERIRMAEVVALQPQDAQLIPRTSVWELVALFASLYTAPASVVAVLEQVGLTELASRRVEALSGGEKRRLLLALAIVGNTPVVLLDEPTTGVDVVTKRALWEVILGLRASGKTIVLATHDMDEAHRLCDRVAIMSSGEVVVIDAPEVLIARAASRGAVEFTLEPSVAASAEHAGFIRELSQLAEPIFDEIKAGVRVTVYAADAEAAIRALTFRRGLHARSVKRLTPTLEDAFIFYAAPAAS